VPVCVVTVVVGVVSDSVPGEVVGATDTDGVVVVVVVVGNEIDWVTVVVVSGVVTDCVLVVVMLDLVVVGLVVMAVVVELVVEVVAEGELQAAAVTKEAMLAQPTISPASFRNSRLVILVVELSGLFPLGFIGIYPLSEWLTNYSFKTFPRATE
jgi:hypothetical protein